MKTIIMTILISMSIFAGDCTNEDVTAAKHMYDKYMKLYTEGAVTHAKAMMAERMYYKTLRCANYLDDETFCIYMKMNLDLIKRNQPAVYADEMYDLSFICD